MNSKIIPKTCTPNSNRGSPLGNIDKSTVSGGLRGRATGGRALGVYSKGNLKIGWIL